MPGGREVAKRFGATNGLKLDEDEILEVRLRRINGKSGFTLVELLVVIGIIALLISMLLPTLNKARNSAKSARCLANLRAYGVAAAAYMAQNRGALATDLTVILPSKSGLIVKYNNCPSVADFMAVPDDGNALPNYTFNAWMVSVNAVIKPRMIKPAKYPNSSELVLLGDTVSVEYGGFTLDSNGSMSDPFFKDASMTIGMPTFHGRHGGNGGVLWLDGHASMMPAVKVPSNLKVTGGTYGLRKTPDWYNQRKVGYLVRSPQDLYSTGGLYYFVSQKRLIPKNDMNEFLKYIPDYGGYYLPNTNQW